MFLRAAPGVLGGVSAELDGLLVLLVMSTISSSPLSMMSSRVSSNAIISFFRGGGHDVRGEALHGGGRGGRGGPPRDNIRYAYSSAPEGQYTVTMSVDGQEQERNITILKDEWWMNRR